MGSVNWYQLAPSCQSCQNIDDIRSHQQAHATQLNHRSRITNMGEPARSSIITSSCCKNGHYEPWPQASVYIPNMNPERKSHICSWTATHALLPHSLGMCLTMVHLKICQNGVFCPHSLFKPPTWLVSTVGCWGLTLNASPQHNATRDVASKRIFTAAALSWQRMPQFLSGRKPCGC